MKVTCSRCGTEYNFDDSKVTEEGVKVKCTRCDNVFRVRKKAYAIPSQQPESAPRSDDVTGGAIIAPMDDASSATFTGATLRQWMIRRSGGDTMEFKEMTTLQRWIVERKVSPSDEISHNGVKWKRLGAIPELAPFFKVVEDEDAASEAERANPRDPRTSTGEFLRAQDEEERKPPRAAKNGNGSANFDRASDARHDEEGERAGRPKADQARVDAWADEGTSRSEAAEAGRDRENTGRRDAERDRRDAERPTHDPSASERSVERKAPGKSRRGLLLGLLLIVAVGASFSWAQFTESGLVASAPARAWLLAMLGASPAATPTPVPTPTAVAAVSPTPEETPVAAVSPIETATPEPTPTEVAPVTPSATAAPTKVAKVSVDKLLQQGFEAYSRGRYREAINKYQAAVNADSDNSEAYALLGLAYLDSGNDDLAESSLEAAIRLNPRFADAHRYLGMLYSRRGDKARAIASFNTYLGLRPNGPTSDDVRRRVASLGG